MSYLVKINEQQYQFLKDSLDHMVEVDLEYVEYTDKQKEEIVLLKQTWDDIPNSEPGVLNSLED